MVMIRIQNNGLGVQSTTIFLMSHEGLIDPIDHSIFADTQEEPEAVYQHLEWMRAIPAPVPILHVGTAGKLGDDLLNETAASIPHEHAPYKENHRHRFASIPVFTSPTSGPKTGCNTGMIRRQCTKEYKIEVIEKILRYEILGLKSRQRFPKDAGVVQIFGISWDERGRAERIKKNHGGNPWSLSFPLIDLRMTRDDCKAWLKGRVPHEVPRSACVFCPYKTATEWLRTKANPKEWARAVEIDRALREPSKVAKRNMVEALFLRRECLPLEMVDLEKAAEKEKAKKHAPLFALMDCGEGMCGV